MNNPIVIDIELNTKLMNEQITASIKEQLKESETLTDEEKDKILRAYTIE